MPVHLVKLAVGIDSISRLRAVQRKRLKDMRARGTAPVLRHLTRHMPRRAADLLDGGSLYWVIKGLIQARQRIRGVERMTDHDGHPCCALVLDPKLVPVAPRAHRAFQGWRYFDPADAPPDRPGTPAGEEELPAAMAAELRGLGLL